MLEHELSKVITMIAAETWSARIAEIWNFILTEPMLAAMIATAIVLIVFYLLYKLLTRPGKDDTYDQAGDVPSHPLPQLDELVQRWEPTTDWSSRLQATDRRPWFSVEVEDALVKGVKQPILLVGMIEDIRCDGDGCVCEIRAVARVRADLKFELHATREMIDPIIQGGASRVGRYAFVATIKKVRRQRFAAMVSGDDVEVGTTHLFIAIGQTHELLRLDT